MQKNYIYIVSTRYVRALRARGRVRAENFEMLRMTLNVLSFVQKVILSIFKF